MRRLLVAQFPQWADLAVRPVELNGWDNTTFRLGDDLTVRLPSGESYALQVEKEHEWLPKLAPRLPLPIPSPLAKGVPTADFPFPWSVYRWIEGETAEIARIEDLRGFATDVADFLAALHRIDPDDGPPPGRHNSYRGCATTTVDLRLPFNVPGNWGTLQAIETLQDRIDPGLVTEVWEAALDSTWQRSPVWVHGDVASSNLLVRDGRLSAVIDFGCSAVGDPACDLAIAWTFLSGESREAFRAALPLDDATWARGRGWSLWKALIVLARSIDTDSDEARSSERVIGEVLADHASHASS